MKNYMNILKGFLFKKDYRIIINLIMSKFKRFNLKYEYKEISFFLKNKDWVNLLEYMNRIEKVKKVDSDFYKIKAIANSKIGENSRGTEYMKKSLELLINEETNKFIMNIEKKIFTYSILESKYYFLGGSSNMGVIFHTNFSNNEEQKITKIINKYTVKNHQISREIVFNDYIRAHTISLQKITPNMISNLDYKKFKLLTFNKKGNVLVLKDDISLMNVLILNKLIRESVTYSTAELLMRNNKLLSFSDVVLRTHKREVHEDYLNNMNHNNSEYLHSRQIGKIINRIKHLVIESKLYESITPENNYILCHGDFFFNNITFDAIDDLFYVIDWESFCFGLKGYDMAYYSVKFDYSFEDIKHKIIPEVFIDSTEFSIEEIFFIYELLISWISNLTQEKLRKNLKTKILPAMTYLEYLIKKYN